MRPANRGAVRAKPRIAALYVAVGLAAAIAACSPAPMPPSGSPLASPGFSAVAQPSSTAAATASPAGPTPAPPATPEPTAVPSPSPTPSPAPAARVIREQRVSSNLDRLTFPWDDASEPIVATHPTDPKRLAVVYERRAPGGTCGMDTTLRISHDGGATWTTAKGRPYAGSGRGPNFHAAIAWGPGPRKGSARLYWVDTTVPGCDYSAHSVSIAWSDDEGATWSRLYVERRTPPWVGGFPEITVDRDPASPNYGAVYVVYNWLASRTSGPGMRLLASSDFGRTWRAAVEIPPAPRPAGCRASWRIAYRARTAPDGAVYVSGYQADLRRWDAAHVFSKGGPANVCRLGFTVTRVVLDRSRKTLARGPTVMAAVVHRSAQAVYGAPAVGTAGTSIDPQWCQGLDVDRSTGVVYLAVADYTSAPRTGTPRGRVRVGRSEDGGRTWTWQTLPAVTLPGRPATGGGLGSSFKPTLAARDGVVFVGFHVITDVPRGTSAHRHRPVVGTYFAVSLDGGRTFAAPAAVTPVRWPAAALERGVNGPGLRERADFTADGRVFYAYADGRRAAPAPSAAWGRGAIYGALIDLGAAPAAGG